MTIKAQRYTFHCRLKTEARLPGYLGSTLRGGLGWALKATSCTLKRQKCANCLLREQCTYAWIFETQSYQAGDGHTINARPHPFVLQPGKNLSGERRTDERFRFSLLLMDRAIDLLPQIVYSVQLMGDSGIGAGRRYGLGRFRLEKVTAGAQTVYSGNERVLQKPDKIETIQLANSGEDNIRSIQVTLNTPLRLKTGNKLGVDLPFHVLIRACLRRISSLEEAYSGGEPELDYRGLVERAGQVNSGESTIHWQKLFRWSNRQRKKVSLSGLGGSIIFQGNLGEFMPLLRYCEQVNIGKQTVFGLGKITIGAPASKK